MNTAQVTRLVMLIIGLIIGWYLLSTLFMVTFPFLLATFLAFLMNPLVTLFEKQIKLPRTLSVMVAIFFIFGVLGTLITLIIWLVIDGVVYLSHYIPPYIEKASVALQFYMNEHILPFWNSSIGFIERLETNQRSFLENGIEQLGEQLAILLGVMGQSLANGLSHVVTALPFTFTAMIVTLLSLYFISRDWNHYVSEIKKRTSQSVIVRIHAVIKSLQKKVIGYLYAQCILISITALIYFFGFLIIDVEHPLTMALIIGLIDFIPYLGTGIIILPWVIYSFIVADYLFAIGLSLLFAIAMLIRQLIEPKVLSSNMACIRF
ncbi:sporulation integral membrane protein YtvI [Bacillus sp. JCM 19034]|uniref:sporulation integral membrane protein YtvI n=1 Tax=Bacillus sp. JCM 19034 TaxID=1481928 RepID=UPI000785758E|nr:sporulation integral membrane protein YtvI [Bacillus sp. JCM 19034]